MSGYLSSKNYDFVRAQQLYNADRSMVLMTFESLVMKKITAAGLWNTVYEFQEVRYSKSKHWQFFEESLTELDDALVSRRRRRRGYYSGGVSGDDVVSGGGSGSTGGGSTGLFTMSNCIIPPGGTSSFPNEWIWRGCCGEEFHNDGLLCLETFRDIGSDDIADCQEGCVQMLTNMIF